MTIAKRGMNLGLGSDASREEGAQRTVRRRLDASERQEDERLTRRERGRSRQLLPGSPLRSSRQGLERRGERKSGRNIREGNLWTMSVSEETSKHMCFHCVAQTRVLRVQLSEVISLRTKIMISHWHYEQLGQSSFSKRVGVIHVTFLASFTSRNENPGHSWITNQFSSVAQSCPTFCDPHGLHHARLPCPSPTPGACSNSCPSSRWCHPTIISSVVPFSGLQSFPASRKLLIAPFVSREFVSFFVKKILGWEGLKEVSAIERNKLPPQGGPLLIKYD